MKRKKKKTPHRTTFLHKPAFLISALVFLLVGLFVTVSHIRQQQDNRSRAVATKEVMAPAGLATSAEYSINIDGTNAFVYNPTTVTTANTGKFAHYSFGGASTHITINSSVDVQTVDVRPKQLNITPKITGKTIEFDLTTPANISVEVNGNLANPLFLFANPLETNKLAAKAGTNVISFTAGKVYKPGDAPLPANGDLHVTSNTTVYIPGGTVIKGKITVGAGKAELPGASNVKIIGTGVVDSTELPDYGRPLRIRNSQDVIIDGPIFLGKKTWGAAVFKSSNVTLKNIKVINWRETTAADERPDGIDIVGSKDVTIDGVFVRSYDDGIAIKNGANGYGEDVNTDVENITISNSVIWNGDAGNAVEIGNETNAQFIKNIRYNNLDIIHKQSRADKNNRAAIGIHVVDGATVSDVRYDDIRIEDAQENYINFKIFKNGFSKTQNFGKIDNIYLKNVRVVGGTTGLPSVLAGNDASHQVSNVTFENLKLFGTTMLSAQQANMTLTNTSNINFIQSADVPPTASATAIPLPTTLPTITSVVPTNVCLGGCPTLAPTDSTATASPELTPIASSSAPGSLPADKSFLQLLFAFIMALLSFLFNF